MEYRRSHDLADWSKPRIASLRDRPDRDVAIGNSADDSVVFADRQKADILVEHLFRRQRNFQRRRDAFDVSRHDFVYFHELSLLTNTSTNKLHIRFRVMGVR